MTKTYMDRNRDRIAKVREENIAAGLRRNPGVQPLVDRTIEGTMKREERDREICQRYLMGESGRKLERIYGISFQRIHQILKNHNIDVVPTRKIPAEALPVIVEKRRNGYTLKQLGNEYGVSAPTILKYVRRGSL